MGELEEIRTLSELVSLARARMSPPIWNYLMGGADSEVTLLRNRHALNQYVWIPRVLRDVSRVNAASPLLRSAASAPFFLAPIGSLSLFDESGATASAEAAAAFGVPCFVSNMSSPHFREVAEKVEGNNILQLYVRGDEDWMLAQAEMARDAGYRRICITVDTAVYGRRERDLAIGFRPKAAIDRPSAAGVMDARGDHYQASFTWKKLASFVRQCGMPVIVKGLQAPDDAGRALDAGIATIYLSNHGGRQLDHSSHPFDTLARVRSLAGPSAEILVDGGFMRGNDILKAIALGADAVGLGKLQGMALAAGGAGALVQAMQILKHELEITMALCGVTSLAELNADYLERQQPLPNGNLLPVSSACMEAIASRHSSQTPLQEWSARQKETEE